MSKYVAESVIKKMTAQQPAPFSIMPRRLSALVTGAATAVIVLCLVALAKMTGVLSTPMSAVRPTAVLMGSVDREASPAMTSEKTVQELLQPIAQNNTAEVPPAPAVMTSTAQALRLKNTASDLQPEASIETSASGDKPALQHAKDRKEKRRSAHKRKPQRLTASVKATSKTRQQVVAELMRAKRDGSYRTTSDTYR